MKALSARDASILALIAENASLPPKLYEELRAELADQDSRDIATVLVMLQRSEAVPDTIADSVLETAQSLWDWGKRSKDRHNRQGRIALAARSLRVRSSTI